VLLGALVAVGPLSIDTYLPAFPAMQDALGVTASQVQLTLTACLAGLALGQLITGPLSDRFGRRRPLVFSFSMYIVASLLCALAPSIAALTALRLVQGLAGGAGMVISQAVVRDLRTGPEAVRLQSSLMLIIGLAPILAPLLGGQLLTFTSWRGIFVALAGVAAAIALMVALGLKETLPPERRETHGLGATLRTLGRLTREPSLMGYALVSGLTFGAIFASVSASPFVLQDIYGASPQLFSLMFAANGIGLVAASQVNGRLAGTIDAQTLLLGGLLALVTASVVLLLVVTVGRDLPVYAVLIPQFAVACAFPFVLPNATVLALADHPTVAGSAAALLGVTQFTIGALAAPIVGVAGTDTAVPMALTMTALSVGALVVRRVLVPTAAPQPAAW
jgi:DHA1 family bicyclomycin/chloramphenicol resistance-like MFS transporter